MKGESITPPPPPPESGAAAAEAAVASPSSIGNPKAASSWSEISVTGCSINGGGGRVSAAAAASLAAREAGHACRRRTMSPPPPRVPPRGTFSKSIVPFDRESDWRRGKGEDVEEDWVRNPVEKSSENDRLTFQRG